MQPLCRRRARRSRAASRKENIAVEAAYLQRAGRASFERPYGLAWLLQLSAELRSWKDPQAQEWAPISRRSRPKPPRASNAGCRICTTRSAWANTTRPHFLRPDLGLGGRRRRCGDAPLVDGCGAAFLCRRPQLPAALRTFGPGFPVPLPRRGRLHAPRADPAASGAGSSTSCRESVEAARTAWLTPAVVTNRSDPKLAHLDGLNLSRAWMLEGIRRGARARSDRRTPRAVPPRRSATAMRRYRR